MTKRTINDGENAPLKPSRVGSICVGAIRVVGAIAILVTLLPIIPIGAWFVRGWDFPRFQIAVSLTFLALIACVWRHQVGTNRAGVLWAIVLLIAGIWQWSHVIPFTFAWPTEVASTPESIQDDFRLLVVNLSYQNDAYSEVIAEIEAADPEVLILIEIDQRWSSGLKALRAKYTHHHDEVRGEGLGISVWSKLAMPSAATRFIVEDRRPSIWATLSHEHGKLNLVAVHPTPPGLKDSTGEDRRDSRVRDAELTLIAKEIAEQSGEAWIVAGDFNDVAWSHTTRLFKRLSGLKDPRIGRSFMGTYHADYALVRFPIDHVFISDGFTVGELSRCRVTGSDHFGVFATLTLTQPSAGTTPEPRGDDQTEAKKIVEQGRKDAEDRGIESDEIQNDAN